MFKHNRCTRSNRSLVHKKHRGSGVESTPRRYTSLPRTPVHPTLGNNIQYGIQQPVIDPHPVRLLPKDLFTGQSSQSVCLFKIFATDSALPLLISAVIRNRFSSSRTRAIQTSVYPHNPDPKAKKHQLGPHLL